MMTKQAERPAPAAAPDGAVIETPAVSSDGRLRLVLVQSVLTVAVLMMVMLLKWMGGGVFDQLRTTFDETLNGNEVLAALAAWMDGDLPWNEESGGETSAPSGIADPVSSEEEASVPSESAAVSDHASDPADPAEPSDTASADPSDEAVSAMAGVSAVPYPEGVSAETLQLDREAIAPLAWGTVTSPFGYRDNPTGSGTQFHYGLDIAASEGTPISAMFFGVVTETGSGGSYGNYLRLYHGNGLSVLYAHCSRVLVKEGDAVLAGETVARVGATGNATGNHLHVEISQDGVRYDPAAVVPLDGYA